MERKKQSDSGKVKVGEILKIMYKFSKNENNKRNERFCI